MKKLLIATTNPAKRAEIKRFLSDIPFELVNLTNLAITQDYEETGATFEENAIGKAQFYAKLSGLPTIADDGGLEIDVLGGKPGVYSKRWIGRENATTQEYIDFVLEQMKDVPQGKRGAQLRTVVALAIPFQDGSEKQNVYSTSAKIRGVIPTIPSTYREDGFPYRSLLFIPSLNKFYNHQEMTEEEEEKYNHRRKVLQELKKIIRQELL